MSNDIKVVSIIDQIKAVVKKDFVTIGQGGVQAAELPNEKAVLIVDLNHVPATDASLSTKGKTYVKVFASGPFANGRVQFGFFENVPADQLDQKMAWREKNPKRK